MSVTKLATCQLLSACANYSRIVSCRILSLKLQAAWAWCDKRRVVVTASVTFADKSLWQMQQTNPCLLRLLLQLLQSVSAEAAKCHRRYSKSVWWRLSRQISRPRRFGVTTAACRVDCILKSVTEVGCLSACTQVHSGHWQRYSQRQMRSLTHSRTTYLPSSYPR